MKIKKGDKVIVISGKDKGKTGAVVLALPAKDKVIVEGVNVMKRHERSRKGRQKGQIIDKTLPIHISNVMLLDPKNGVRTRVRVSREGGKRIRVAVKSGASLSN